MKRPAFQFYPADWRKDVALQSCSLVAQGFWINALCLMHECEPYGRLAVNGKPMQAPQLARTFGITSKEAEKLVVELEEAGVCSRDDGGFLYSRRMVRDEHIRNLRSSAGKLGGNPNLLDAKVKQKVKAMVKQTDNHTSNLGLTPSSSSSSSSSTSVNPKAAAFALPDWIPPDLWDAFMVVRKAKRAANTPFALGLLVKELEAIREKGHDPLDAIARSVKSGWADVYAPKFSAVGGTAGLSKQAALEENNRRAVDDFVRMGEAHEA